MFQKAAEDFGALHIAALLVALVAALTSGLLQRSTSRLPKATLCTALIVAATYFAQLTFPRLLLLLEREPSMLWSGELWRALTALFVQDTVPAGALFNLFTLLCLGSVAESRLGSARWLAIYFCAGVVAEFLALAWQPYGAGNSIACCALAGALIINGFKKSVTAGQLCVCLVSLCAGLVLLLLKDIHGVGYFDGALCALLLRRLKDARLPPATSLAYRPVDP